MKTRRVLRLWVPAALISMSSCSPGLAPDGRDGTGGSGVDEVDEDDPEGSGGKSASGEKSSKGTGGAKATGGAKSSGGADAGGSSSGGVASETGGDPGETGGSDPEGDGGKGAGGAVETGGTSSGGAPSGGTSSGGAPSGGSGSGSGGKGGSGGGSGSGGGGTGGTNFCTASEFTVSDGYVDNGMFCGYGWNRYFDATVDPACIGEGVGPCFEESLCMDVSMPATQPHNGVQPVTGIAFNVAQRVNGTKTGYSGGFKSITPTFTTSGLGGEMRAYVSTGSTD